MIRICICCVSLFVILLIALLWLTRVRAEGFADMNEIQALIAGTDMGSLPDPHAMFKQVRTLLDRYDKPEVWNDSAQMMDKDPGELARMYIESEKAKSAKNASA
jgi:hypothetical protein